MAVVLMILGVIMAVRSMGILECKGLSFWCITLSVTQYEAFALRYLPTTVRLTVEDRFPRNRSLEDTRQYQYRSTMPT